MSSAESSRVHQLDELKEKARAETDEALQAALAEASRLAEVASERSRAVNETRLLVINLVVGWIDQAEGVETNASARRRRNSEGRVVARTAAMAEFNQKLSEEQRDLLCRVRDRGEEALAVGRIAVAEKVAEIIRGGWRTEEGGGRLVSATNHDDRAEFHPTSTTVALLPDTLFGGEMEQDEGQLNAVAQRLDASPMGGMEDLLPVGEGVTNHEETDERAGTNNRVVQGSVETVIGGVVADHIGPGDVPDDTPIISPPTDGVASTPPPSLDELQTEPFLAVQVDAEASCLADIDAWAEAARSRAKTVAELLFSQAVSDDSEERLAVETEWKTLEVAFLGAQKKAKEAAVASWRSWRASCGGRGGIHSPGKTENGGGTGEKGGDKSDGGFDDSVSTFAVKEQEECARLWASMEQLVASRIQMATQHAGIGLIGCDEVLKSVEDEAMVRVAELEAGLRSTLVDMAAAGDNDMRAMVAADREKLRLAFVRAQEEKTQEERALGEQYGHAQEEEALTEHGGDEQEAGQEERVLAELGVNALGGYAQEVGEGGHALEEGALAEEVERALEDRTLAEQGGDAQGERSLTEHVEHAHEAEQGLHAQEEKALIEQGGHTQEEQSLTGQGGYAKEEHLHLAFVPEPVEDALAEQGEQVQGENAFAEQGGYEQEERALPGHGRHVHEERVLAEQGGHVQEESALVGQCGRERVGYAGRGRAGGESVGGARGAWARREDVGRAAGTRAGEHVGRVGGTRARGD